jgi:tetratricopeptide (TPR) repeat protein
VWFDEQLPAHRTYSEVIEEQLDAAKAVVVLWSLEAVRSQWVRSEANRARETDRLVQLRLDDSRLPMPFDQIQCADLRDWPRSKGSPAWDSVLESIGALVGNDKPAKRAASPAKSRGIGRREVVLAGGAAAIVGVAGYAGWRMSEEPKLSPQATLLLQKGNDALQNNDALDPQGLGSTAQAIALLTEATEAAPTSAEAWGSLAMAYAVRKKVAPVADRAGLAARARSAAHSALKLDSTEPRGLAALRLIEPAYRNWLVVERGDREAVQRSSKTPILLFIMSDMLGQVGRWRDALGFSSRFDRTKWLIPGAERKLIVDLWSAGEVDQADRFLKTAVEHWPQHPQIWRTRVIYLMFSGRPADSLDLLEPGAERPQEISDDFVAATHATAEALAGRRPAESAVDEALAYLSETPGMALQTANACTALGAHDDALEILGGYYFNEGRWKQVAPSAGDQDRITNPLFLPPMQSLWRDSRFGRILERIGLENYWRQSGTLPDFRRA